MRRTSPLNVIFLSAATTAIVIGIGILGYFLGSQHSSSSSNQITDTPTVQNSQVLDDKNIASVTTDAKNLFSGAKFPNGLFSKDMNEWGLINYGNYPITLTITFKHPVSIFSLENIFTHCPSKYYPNGYTGTTGCYYVISIKGFTDTNKNVTLVYPNTVYPQLTADGISPDNLENTYYIDTSFMLRQITFYIQRFGADPDNYVHLKKVYITYSK